MNEQFAEEHELLVVNNPSHVQEHVDDLPRGDYLDDGDYNGGFGYYHLEGKFGANIGAVEWQPGWRTDVEFEWPEELRFIKSATLDMGNIDRLPQEPDVSGKSYREIIEEDEDLSNTIIDQWDSHFRLIGYPIFKSDYVIDDSDYVEDLKNLLYYNQLDDSVRYDDTSYPLEVNLNIELYNQPSFENPEPELDEQERENVLTGFQGNSEYVRSYLNSILNIPQYANNPNECHYKYQVIQWGDEKNLISDDQIKSSYFFSFYDSEEYPRPEDYFYKKYQQSQEVEAIPIEDVKEHTYNTPGIKTIKVIVYRYTPNSAFILQTYCITKNIVVNDGIVKSQDFAVFGGGDFKFLPISDNQAIIGGFDKDSEYNNSVEKIVKDDKFKRDDYLDEISSKDYIENFNNQFLGEKPGQLNLGQIRFFNKPKDIYDFIGGNKLMPYIGYQSSSEWITKDSGSLPFNSLATDIFIDNDNCVIDLRPSETEYSVIENKAGLSKGILVGDYKLNQSEDGSVSKQGIMKIPKLDTVKDRQAF